MDKSIRFSEYLLHNLDKVQFQKRFGQNFLLSDEYPRKLVASANLSKNDVVIEIGTGLGSITNILSDTVNTTISFEIDTDFYDKATAYFSENSSVTILNQDILFVPSIANTINHIVNASSNESDTNNIGEKGYKVVASLPYNISKKVIKYFLDQKVRPDTMTYIIQNEVAQNYAPKNSRETFLSNYIKLYGEAFYICKVPKEEFHPIPKVDGGIIHIEIDPIKANSVSQELIKFIKGGFSAPRKTISNVLSNMLHKDKDEINVALDKLCISSSSRAENLGIENWKELYKILAKAD